MKLLHSATIAQSSMYVQLYTSTPASQPTGDLVQHSIYPKYNKPQRTSKTPYNPISMPQPRISLLPRNRMPPLLRYLPNRSRDPNSLQPRSLDTTLRHAPDCFTCTIIQGQLPPQPGRAKARKAERKLASWSESQASEAKARQAERLSGK